MYIPIWESQYWQLLLQVFVTRSHCIKEEVRELTIGYFKYLFARFHSTQSSYKFNNSFCVFWILVLHYYSLSFFSRKFHNLNNNTHKNICNSVSGVRSCKWINQLWYKYYIFSIDRFKFKLSSRLDVG